MSAMHTHSDIEKQNSVNGHDHAENIGSAKQRVPYDYGGNPLARADTAESAR